MGASNKNKPVVPAETPVVRYKLAVSSLDVGGVVRGLKKGKTLSKKVVIGLKKQKAGEVSMFDALLKRGAIVEYTPETPAVISGDK